MQYTQYTSDQESLSNINEYQQTRIKTAIPAHVVSYDKAKQTVSVSIPFEESYETVEGVKTEAWGTIEDVPVQWPRGGGGSLTFPIQKGDLVLLVCSARSIDEWWKTDGTQTVNPRSLRMHDISDAFAIPGIGTDSTALPADAVSDDGAVITMGDTRIEVKKDGKINTRCNRLNIGADSAGTALAKANATDDRLSAVEGKINDIIAATAASGGLLIPGTVLPIIPGPSTASAKAFTND